MSDKYFEIIRKMDTEFELYSDKSSVFEWIKDDVYLRYFMNRCKSVEWFVNIRDRGLFNAERVPLPFTNEDGSVSIPYWSQLDYLVNVSEQIKDGVHSELAEKLLQIVREVSEYRNDENPYIDNYYVWDKFTSILFNLTNKSIHAFLQENDVDFKIWLKVWLGSKYNKSVVSSDLVKKLLSKFLPDSPTKDDIGLAERIVKQLLDVRITPIDHKGARLSVKHSEGKLTSDDHWVVDGLIKKQLAKKLGVHCSSDFLLGVINQVRELLQYEWFDEYTDVEKDEIIYRIVVRRVEQDEERHINQGVFNIDVRKLGNKSEKEALEEEQSNDRDAVLTLGVSIESFKIKEVHGREQFVAKIIKNTPDLQGLDSVQKAKIKTLFLELHHDHSYIWLKSIKAGSQYYSKEALTILIICLRDLLSAKAENGDISDFLETLSSDEYSFPFFKRLVFFIVTSYYKKYGQYAKQIIMNNPDIFCRIAYERELYELLQNNVDDFDKDREFIENVIMFIPEYIDKVDRKKAVAHTQACFLMALSKLEYFKNKMEQICKEADILCSDIEEPRSQSVVTWTGAGKSFYDEEWFLEHSVFEIVSMFSILKDEDRFSPNCQSVHATADVFKEAVKNDPSKFVDEIDDFINAKFICVNSFLSGLQEAWKDEKKFSWGKVLEFIRDYLKCDYFQSKDVEGGRIHSVDRNWIIGSSAHLLSLGSRDENPAFDESNFDLCESVFSVLLNKRYCELPKTNNIQEVINTSYGSVIESYIFFSLRCARVNEKSGKEKGFISDVYDTLLNSEAPEAFTFLGRYLINFMYLDEKWTLKKIEQLKNIDTNGILWKGFFQGYLWGGGVYGILYGPMQWHYKKAIETGHDYDSVQEQIVEHAVMEYLRSEIDNPLESQEHLLRFVLDRNDYDSWKSIVNTFWSRANECIEKIEQKEDVEFVTKSKDRIKEFWKWCFENDNAKNRLGKGYNDFLSDISRLICVFAFDSISEEIYEQMKEVALYVDRFYNSAEFIEYLNRYRESDEVEKVGKIFQEMLTESLPTYNQEHICSIVEKLYDNRFKDVADDICNTYGINGIHFLRDLWQKNNPKWK